MKIKLVSDCSANICENISLPVAYAPLKIVTSEKEYIDIPSLDVPAMLQELKRYKGPSSTACPGLGDWLEAFGDADRVLGVTLTSTLSGCYNSAIAAAEEFKEQHPGAEIFILDSLSTGPELEVILEKMQELAVSDLPFEEIVAEIKDYLRHTHLMFALSSVDNFVKNGRVSPILGKAIGVLDLKIVGQASSEGTLEPMNKCRGERRAIPQVYANMKAAGYCGGKVRLSHSYHEPAALALRDLILADFPDADVHICINRGLCCYYAEEYGLLIGFEDLPA